MCVWRYCFVARLLDDLAGPGAEEILEVEIGRGLLAHFLDVRACGKGLVARTGQDCTKLALVRFIGGEGLGQFRKDRAVERVERLGTVERDQRDRVTFFDGDGFVSQCSLHVAPAKSGA